jgi:Domain of unknown function (DUF4126)
MEQLNELANIIALTMGVAWACGINLYAAILMLGILGATGNMALPSDLAVLTEPIVIGAAGIMYFVEFFVDKVPGLDNSWDTVHTFIRIPAGALLAAGAVGEVDPAVSLAAAIIGGGLAACTHTVKTGSRILINTSPEPFSNWTASIAEDVVVVGGLWTAFQHPWLFIVLLILFILLAIWLIPKIWSGIKKVFQSLCRFFVRNPSSTRHSQKSQNVLNNISE